MTMADAAITLKLPPVPNLNAGQVYDAIVAAHPGPEWCVLCEVADATSAQARRRADALAMNMWASRNLEIRGFEIKVHRSDLKRELESPAKAEAVGRYCHTWSLAVPEGLVRGSDSVPPSWGIFEVDAKGVGKWARQPTMRPAEEVAQPSRLFTAAIARAACAEVAQMRNGGDWIRRADVQAKLDAEYERGMKNAPNDHAGTLALLQAKVSEMQPIVDLLGIELGPARWKWNTREVVRALKLGQALQAKFGGSAVKMAIDNVVRAAEALEGIPEVLRSLLVEESD